MLPALGLLTLTLAAAPAPEPQKAPLPSSASDLRDKMLLCHPLVLGTPTRPIADAFMTATRRYADRFLDYGNLCETVGEAARAAHDVRLRYGLMTIAQEEPTGSRFVLHLTEAATERVVLRKDLLVPLNVDPVKPLERALNDIVSASTGERTVRWAPWVVTGVGAVALAIGTGFAVAAHSASSDGAAATTPDGVLHARRRYQRSKTVSTIALSVGGAAVAGGLVWRFAF